MKDQEKIFLVIYIERERKETGPQFYLESQELLEIGVLVIESPLYMTFQNSFIGNYRIIQ